MTSIYLVIAFQSCSTQKMHSIYLNHENTQQPQQHPQNESQLLLPAAQLVFQDRRFLEDQIKGEKSHDVHETYSRPFFLSGPKNSK